MQFQWQDHHFIAGRRCLDFANTVVYARDPLRREDRLNSPAAIVHWLACSPAGMPDDHDTRSASDAGGKAPPDVSAGGYAAKRFFIEAIRARTAIDDVFRNAAGGGFPDPAAWRDLVAIHADAVGCPGIALEATADGLALCGETRGAPPFLASITHDALTLALSPRLQRVKECPGCHWLFVDATRNGRKRWCEMRTCGNRAKAMRYSDRVRAKAEKGGKLTAGV